MIYTHREQLAVIELQEKRDTLPYEALFAALMKRPSNIVYVEVKGLLYGIVTTGQMLRSRQDQLSEVRISTAFRFLRPGEYMKARKQLHDWTNWMNKIHVIPVVSFNGELLGDYAKRDDLFSMEHFLKLLKTLKVSDYAKGIHIALVQPAADSQVDQNLFQAWKLLLETKGASVEAIGIEQVLNDSTSAGYILCFDQRERKMLSDILRAESGKNQDGRFPSCLELLHVLSDPAEEILCALREQGVFVLTFHLEENKAGYLSKFHHRNRKRLLSLGRVEGDPTLTPQIRAEFLEELAEPLAGQELPCCREAYLLDGVCMMCDASGPFFNIYHGNRKTTHQPEKYNRCIHVFGPCVIYGQYADDAHTIPSLLQEKINEAGFPCRVENYGGPNERNYLLSRLLAAPIKRGDIVIYDMDREYARRTDRFQNCNITDILEKYQPPLSWFVNRPYHCNHKVNRLLAGAFYEQLAPVLQQQPAKNRQPVEQGRGIIEWLYLESYFSDFDPSAFKTVGSIVMNCNPFTLGHRYLVEEALKQVDFLIIFVVEEDRSLFSFEERFAMACAGIAGLQNLMVLPSGSFILSSMTFPEYFVKKTDEEIARNTENDIRLFAEKIAPRLGITHRFVGEELTDEVTDTYNQAMKCILPAHGIQLIEIPRMRTEQGIVSATRVRNLLETGGWDQLGGLLPPSTMQILSHAREE